MNIDINCTKPSIMGIVNVTPDSFVSIGRFEQTEAAVDYALSLIADGADIIDIGAEATSPHTQPTVTPEIELERLLPVLTILRKETNVPISIDTSQPAVMMAASDAGADMINDVRALRLPGALQTAAKLKLPVCLMHMHTIESNMHPMTAVISFLKERLSACLEADIDMKSIILDPGIGAGHFGKTCRQNLALLRDIPQLADLGFPVLVGVSRKQFIGELLDLPKEERLIGSITAGLYAIKQGASFLRVHDVRATKQAFTVHQAITQLGV